MRIGVLGDVHSNFEALQAVVRSMRGDAVDHWVQVGDIVGYGADPCPCIDLIRSLGCTVCMGNHAYQSRHCQVTARTVRRRAGPG